MALYALKIFARHFFARHLSSQQPGAQIFITTELHGLYLNYFREKYRYGTPERIPDGKNSKPAGLPSTVRFV